MEGTPQWGIEPVPERLRVLGLMDTTLLWTNLGISLLVLVLPAYFDLPLRDALAATLVGALIGNRYYASSSPRRSLMLCSGCRPSPTSCASSRSPVLIRARFSRRQDFAREWKS